MHVHLVSERWANSVAETNVYAIFVCEAFLVTADSKKQRGLTTVQLPLFEPCP